MIGPLRIHQIVTGELESLLNVSLLNSGSHPRLDPAEVLPFGFRDDITRLDGSKHSGSMVPVPVWLIEGTDRTILIDTGLGDVNEVAVMQSRYGVDYVASRAGRDQDVVAGLANYGVTPQDVDVVVLTHLHFDHIGNNELFTNAEFVVQRDELPQSIAPPSFCMFYYPEYSYKVTSIRERLRVVDGDIVLADGVRLLKIGGHTPGCMVVMVDTPLGTVCLTSDVMYNYRNLDLDWPMGSFWDLPDLMAGFARIKLASDLVVPEHDWEFRERFPTGSIG